MKLEWMLLAEGLGQDSKGAITAIGLNQNVLITPILPAQTKRAIFAHFVQDNAVDDGNMVKPGDKMVFRVSFMSPSGKIIHALTSPAALAEMPWSDLPISVDMPAEMMLSCSEYGTYKIAAEVELPGGQTIGGELGFYVREPQKPSV